jgi:hypothetical protein
VRADAAPVNVIEARVDEGGFAMTLAPAPHVVVVDAPDGPAALALERRLADLKPVVIARGDCWIVEIPAVDAPAEIEAAIRTWLTEIGLDHTLIRVDGSVSRVDTTRRHVPSNAGFVG